MQTLKYPTIVHPVREIALLGAAASDYWREHLRAYRLFPYNDNGHAQILVSATSFKWNGLSSRECIFAVMLSRSAEETSYDGAFLLHAFNSSKIFALAERRAFATPYYYATIELDTGAPRYQVRVQKETILQVARKNTAPVLTTDETWEHPIVLPLLNGEVRPPQKFFVAKLTGATQIIPFAPEDECALYPSAHAPVIQHLRDSNFTPTAWHLRADATHYKSNTFTIGKSTDSFFDTFSAH